MPSSKAAAAAPAPLISNEQIRHLYVTLLRCRLLRERNRLKATALVAREALVIGTVTHLTEGDSVVPAMGDHVAALARGHKLRSVLAGTPLKNILPAAASATAQFAIATGHAMAHRGSAKVTLAFSGPGVSNEAELGSVLSYAGLHKPGVVFVVETARDFDPGTEAHGVCTIPADGNDVIAIYRVAQEAIARARRGVGPTIIDCRPWPLTAKTDGSSDPVRRLEQALERRGLESAKLKEKTVAAFRRELAAAGEKRRG